MTPSTDTQPNTEDEDEISLLDLLQTVADNLRLLVLGPLAAGVLALGITFLITPTFTATTKFMPPQQNSSSEAVMLKSLGALGGLAGAAGIKNPNDQFIAFLKSNSVEDALVERFKLMERYDAKYKVDARKVLEANSKITSGKDGLITAEVDDKDPAFAAQLANGYIEELSKLLMRLSVTEAQQRRAFFEKLLNQTKDKLVVAEQALKASGVNSSVTKTSGTAVAGVAQLQAQIAVQQVKLGTMRGYLAESAPEFKQAQVELAAMQSQLKQVDQPSSAANASEADYLGRYRDFKYYEALFELFARQFEMAKVDEAREGSVVQVVDFAEPPEKKSKPKKAMIAMITSVATGFVLLLFIFIRQAMRGAAQTPETAEKIGRLRQAWDKALGRKRSIQA